MVLQHRHVPKHAWIACICKTDEDALLGHLHFRGCAFCMLSEQLGAAGASLSSCSRFACRAANCNQAGCRRIIMNLKSFLDAQLTHACARTPANTHTHAPNCTHTHTTHSPSIFCATRSTALHCELHCVAMQCHVFHTKFQVQPCSTVIAVACVLTVYDLCTC